MAADFCQGHSFPSLGIPEGRAMETASKSFSVAPEAWEGQTKERISQLQKKQVIHTLPGKRIVGKQVKVHLAGGEKACQVPDLSFTLK